MSTTSPQGMVDHLPSDGWPGEIGVAFARAYVAEGPMAPAFLATLSDPARLAERERLTTERRLRDWPGVSQYRDANAALAGQRTNVVFLGDSITEIWGEAQPDLFTGGNVNRGISSQTSPQMLVRFMADVVALKPRAVHLMCGVNDVCGNTGPSTPQDFQNNILAMLALAQAHGIAVILASLTPLHGAVWAATVDDAGGRVAQLNSWLASLARERGLIFVDYFAVLADGEGRLRADLTRDALHPTGRGYDLMRPVTDRAIAQALSA